MNDLIAFLRERYDEEARAARLEADDLAERLRGKAQRVADMYGDADPPEDEVSAADQLWWVAQDAAQWIDRHGPARVLREVEAKRTLLKSWEHLQRSIEGTDDREKRDRYALTRHGLGIFVYQFAAVYADHPDYKDKWRP